MFHLHRAIRQILPRHPFRRIHYSFAVDYNIIRNIGVSAHIDSGKTTFSERVLYYAGKINSIHEVKGSDSVGATMDFMELERQKGITIQSAATNLKWKGHYINLIDTPGHVDFTIEVERALRVLDGGILLICGVAGVQPQTLTVNKQMMRYDVPRIIFINKLDRMGANPFHAIDSIRVKLGLVCAPVQIPIGADDRFRGIVDIINQKAFYFDGPNGDIIREQPIPDNLKDQVKDKRLQLLQKLAEVDPEMQARFLQQRMPTAQQFDKAIRTLTITRKFIPVYMGSAYKNKGVQLALDGVIKYLPSPPQKENHGYITVKDKQGKKVQQKIVLQTVENKPFVGYVFKLQESKFGQLTYIRVYQGKLKKGDVVWNQKLGKKLKVSRMVKMHADQMEEISDVKAGDIFAIFGVECSTGQTLTQGDMSNIIKSQSMHVPSPVMSLTVRPAKPQGSAKFQKALNKFQRQDPTFKVNVDKETEQIIISGMGQLHLQIYVQRIKRQFGVEVKTGSPGVNYRQTITKKSHFDYLHKKQTGGAGQYARVVGYIQPIQSEEAEPKCQFVSKIVGTSIPPQYITAVEKAFNQLVLKGPQTGYPVIGVRYVLEDGATHVVDSSANAFAAATRYSFTKALQNAGAQVLEPLMDVEVNCNKGVYSGVMTGLVKRKGSITKTETKGDMYCLRADVPLKQMFGYAMQIRGLTSGEGDFSMQYKKHTAMSPQDARQAIQKYKKSKKLKQ